MSHDKSIIEKISETASNMYNTAAEKVSMCLHCRPDGGASR